MLRDVPATVTAGLRLGGRDVLVRRVFLSAGSAGSAVAAVELLTPGRAAALAGASESGAVFFAALACAGFVCAALGSHLAPLAARLAGSGERAVSVGLGTGAGGLLLLGATSAHTGAGPVVLAALGYGLVHLGLGSAGPSRNDALHRRVSAAGRATALSVQSLALQLAGALAGLLAGALPPGPLPWGLGAAALLAGALPWTRGTPQDAPAAPQAPPAPVACADPAKTGR
ncbi:hypothetical protein [Streptomyces sp. NPDC001389]|uniref:hypothetical protein n=1 Tax=Streptomyces sp. NPDC001389 TaxID=3364569 RepID=UPI0036C54E32